MFDFEKLISDYQSNEYSISMTLKYAS